MRELQALAGGMNEGRSKMILRILAIWFTANFLLIGVVSAVSGGWYLGWSPVGGVLAELAFIMLPNFLLSILVLRYWWPSPIDDLRGALGWRWRGWRTLVVGAIAFIVLFLLSLGASRWLGEGIPYELPGRVGGIGPVEGLPAVLGLLALLAVMIVVTVAGEETMFRGLIQTQLGREYGWLAGWLAGAVLFGLRHLPADLFYARAWSATPQMWLSREVQLYAGALVFGLARRVGGSTYASAIAHGLLFVIVLYMG